MELKTKLNKTGFTLLELYDRWVAESDGLMKDALLSHAQKLFPGIKSAFQNKDRDAFLAYLETRPTLLPEDGDILADLQDDVRAMMEAHNVGAFDLEVASVSSGSSRYLAVEKRIAMKASTLTSLCGAEEPASRRFIVNDGEAFMQTIVVPQVRALLASTKKLPYTERLYFPRKHMIVYAVRYAFDLKKLLQDQRPLEAAAKELAKINCVTEKYDFLF